jgi:hypothetical protein
MLLATPRQGDVSLFLRFGDMMVSTVAPKEGRIDRPVELWHGDRIHPRRKLLRGVEGEEIPCSIFNIGDSELSWATSRAISPVCKKL